MRTPTGNVFGFFGDLGNQGTCPFDYLLMRDDVGSAAAPD